MSAIWLCLHQRAYGAKSVDIDARRPLRNRAEVGVGYQVPNWPCRCRTPELQNCRTAEPAPETTGFEFLELPKNRVSSAALILADVQPCCSCVCSAFRPPWCPLDSTGTDLANARSAKVRA